MVKWIGGLNILFVPIAQRTNGVINNIPVFWI